MSTEILAPADPKRELEAVVANLGKGPRDLEEVRKACERMDRMREELRQRIGIVDAAVDLVRDARNQ